MNIRLLIKKIPFLLATVIIGSSCVTRIACVGDSITEGAGIKNQSKQAYPVVLNEILGDRYTVLNAGRSAATLQKSGDLPYWNCNEFSNVFAFKPSVIVIKLGTNDTKPQNWNSVAFEKDYQSMIDTFQTISPRPKIVLCKPVPVFGTRWGINDSTLVYGVIPTIEKLSQKNKLEVIDLYQGMKEEKSNFPDDIHPNAKGAAKMAKIISSQL